MSVRISVSDGDGNRVCGWAAAGSRPAGLAADASRSRPYVADAGAQQIMAFDPAGRPVLRFGQRGDGPREFNYPSWLAVDATGRRYVTDSLNFRFQIFAPGGERAGGFPRQSHVVEDGTSCAVCYDAHGSREGAHLINFMTRYVAGAVVVTASSSGRLEYDSLGVGTSRCSLTWHGRDHNPLSYP